MEVPHNELRKPISKINIINYMSLLVVKKIKNNPYNI